MGIEALRSVGDVNRAVEGSPSKLVAVRFGDAGDPLCMHMDSLLEAIQHKVSNYVVIYTCELSSVRELIAPMGLDSPMNITCFYNFRHIKIDCSTGDNNKINFFIRTGDMLVDLLTLAYKAGVRNKGIAVSPLSFKELGGGM
jgi:U5 snRNP protein, DIM1 family